MVMVNVVVAPARMLMYEMSLMVTRVPFVIGTNTALAVRCGRPNSIVVRAFMDCLLLLCLRLPGTKGIVTFKVTQGSDSLYGI
jgi:hypothetical protein